MSRRVNGLIARAIALLLAGLILWTIHSIWPQHWTEKSDAHIKATPEQVFAYLEGIDKWPLWLGWKVSDPSWVHVLGPIQKGMGASLQWNGSLSGVGTLKLTQVQNPHRIEAEIQMNQGGKGQQIIELSSDSTGTLLQITTHFDLGFNPWARYTLRELRSMTQTRIALECHQLKAIAEKDAQWATALSAAAADSVSQIPMDTISTEIPLAE